jgi:hypothetical protein
MKNFLTQTELKLWHIMVGFAVSTIVSIAINQHLNDRQVIAQQRVAEVNAFLDSTREFEQLTRTYVVKVTKTNKADEAAREALAANVQKQYALLEMAQGYLSPADQKEADTYRGDLVRLVRALNESSDIPTTRPFFVEFNSTMVQRKKVVAALRKAADLPAEKET